MQTWIDRVWTEDKDISSIQDGINRSFLSRQRRGYPEPTTFQITEYAQESGVRGYWTTIVADYQQAGESEI